MCELTRMSDKEIRDLDTKIKRFEKENKETWAKMGDIFKRSAQGKEDPKFKEESKIYVMKKDHILKLLEDKTRLEALRNKAREEEVKQQLRKAEKIVSTKNPMHFKEEEPKTPPGCVGASCTIAGKRRLKRRKTHKRRWASRTTLRRY